MSRYSLPICFGTLFVALGTTGCETLWGGRAPYRDDPMLATRQPVIANPEEAKPRQLAFAEPALPALPVRESEPARSLQAVPVARRKISGTFGHAADYSWLQGKVRKRPAGGWELIFTERPAEAAWSGRIVLNGDAWLNGLRDGDIV